jgi:hypothetical protein
MGKIVGLATAKCESCGAATIEHTMTSFGSEDSGYQDICLRCFNQKCAERMGIGGFEHADFEPMSFMDHAGVEHAFFFQLRLHPSGVGLYAEETGRPPCEGYEFSVGGDFLDDPMELFEELHRKIKRGLSTQHLDMDGALHIKDQSLRGHISSNYDDTESGEPEPVFVIDGRPVTLGGLGKMLLSFEGWQFRLEILDKFAEP